jgi:hypothetical protein
LLRFGRCCLPPFRRGLGRRRWPGQCPARRHAGRARARLSRKWGGIDCTGPRLRLRRGHCAESRRASRCGSGIVAVSGDADSVTRRPVVDQPDRGPDPNHLPVPFAPANHVPGLRTTAGNSALAPKIWALSWVLRPCCRPLGRVSGSSTLAMGTSSGAYPSFGAVGRKIAIILAK